MPSEYIKITANNALSFDMIFVERGEYLMGDDTMESRWNKPAHSVSVNSFYLGKYQVTQGLWLAITGDDPSRFKGENRPVENVSWLDAQNFIKKLNKETGRDFRLPTESEWEFAARGGIYSQGYDYCGSDKLKQVGWYRENSNRETHDVGLLLANELGLYDMSGNVWEWCEDDFHGNYNDAPKDGSVWIDSPKRGGSRVRRGGNSFGYAGYCSPTYRLYFSPSSRDGYIGFRLCLSLQSAG